ncbi:uncharacterized protein F4812DRAFT_432563 [Daldinia caldariorum]|uniref:uncharacterized protein n=1 Tax=Daldinia caldariorum TaxID=326644 RepID=UPI002008E477|nr:uncharacterized protein F4812DRAFT_432563 [Daldinia caldariorum]KAI1466723.1 hypothetical protein F4812DRAFT_432563 [Daldinia caldariorum]
MRRCCHPQVQRTDVSGRLNPFQRRDWLKPLLRLWNWWSLFVPGIFILHGGIPFGSTQWIIQSGSGDASRHCIVPFFFFLPNVTINICCCLACTP